MPEKFYITTAIPYTNGEPHIGHFLEFIQADVIARYKRLLGKEVFFLTGTDEHGIKIAETAQKLNREPKAFVDEISSHFRSATDALNISYSDFIRTTDQQKHWPSVRKLWELMVENGDIYKGHYQGRYCVGCEKYVTDSDLENGLCPLHQKPPEELDEDNYFFRLSKYQDQLKRIITDGELKIVPEFRRSEILSFIDQGLVDVSFSRPKEKLQWGIPVPGDDSQVIYVWADALTNYLSGVGFFEAGVVFQRFWPPDLQIVGKDIWRFHALYWPAMLFSARLPLPKTLLIHGFLTVNGQKISKSLGNTISPIEIMQKFEVSSDAVRYFFLREVSPFEDGDYSDEKFLSRYNGDLANGIGNLLARVVKLGVLYGKEILLTENVFQERIAKTWEQYHSLLGEFRFNDALALVNQLVSEGDGYINEQKPWELLKNQPQTVDNEQQKRFEKIISSLVMLLGNISWLLNPFMPQTSEKILLTFGLASSSELSSKQNQAGDLASQVGAFESNKGWYGRKIRLSEPIILFPRR